MGSYRQALQRLEDRARRLAVGSLRAAANQLLVQISARYLLLVGGLENSAPLPAQQQLRHELVLGLSQMRPHQQDRLWPVVGEAYVLGAARGGVPGIEPQLSPQLDTTLRQAHSRALDALRAAADRARLYDLQRYGGVAAAVAGAHAVAGSLERTATWSVHRAASEGVREATRRLSLPRMWVPEPGACLHCLAYAGAIAQPDEGFHGGSTYYIDPSGRQKPVRWADHPDPPLHPWCRCGTAPYTGQAMRARRDVALRREAQRAVLSGKADASNPAKTRALDGLLASAEPLLVSKPEVRRARRRMEARDG